MDKHFSVFLLLIGWTLSGHSQHQELSEPSLTYKQKPVVIDSPTKALLDVFRHSTWSGHFRYFFMATDNESPYTDYFANAIGGGLKMETAPLYHLRVGISGFYIFNVGSSNFAKRDSVSQQLNRYESALFDINNPSKKSDMDRLEELYVSYENRGTHITFGKQMINTPFVNLQDGRMRPTGVEGLWLESRNKKRMKLELGYLYRISPRSTFSYYDIGKSIGMYPIGVNEDGSKSDYRNNLQSKGIFIGGISGPIFQRSAFQIWNQFVENIFNTSMLQADMLLHKNAKHEVNAGLQSIIQIPVHDGGNSDIHKSYFDPQSRSISFGAKLVWNRNKSGVSINYNRITAHGRYLMPREWGREPFFTFLPRERNEGLGDVHAILLKLNHSFPVIRLKTTVGLGYYDLPEVTNFRLNKYGMPSYTQCNLDIRYQFAGVLKGLDAQLLFVRKWKATQQPLSDKNIINKVQMTQLNAVLNFRY
ncbi:MAG: outer membrane porin, OprD family [Bacteroidetes bacterium]|nr:outer membrane porin, OprD family [Bacteroidota bacterium]MBP6314284.1 OprD family outer membrane porin [Chitinophagaceae bacterium]